MTVDVLHDAKDGVGYIGALKRKGNTVWAVGGAWGSPLVMTSAGGTTFRRRKPPDASGLRDVLPLGEKHALVVGETGALFETKDGESWRGIETGTKGCLFSLERAHGSIWLAGDAALVMSSADGLTWRKPNLGDRVKELGRIQRLTHAQGALWLLGFTGKLGVLKKEEVEIAPLEAPRPVTAIAFTPRGVGLVVGDGGTVFRSTNKGRAWTRMAIETEDDLEDVIWSDGRFVIVGAKGTVLVSDDGEAFRVVQTERDEHLWCVLQSSNAGVIVGGDNGLVLGANKEALAASKPGTNLDARRAPDAKESELPKKLSDEELASASARWMDEGNRKDMTLLTLVQRAVVQLNRESRLGELRRLFPPSLEAFDGDGYTRSVQPVCCDDGSVLARVDGVVYRIRAERARALSGLKAFGRSRDHEHFAVAYADRIEVRRRSSVAAHTVLPIPESLGDIDTIDVFPNGERVLVATTAEPLRGVGSQASLRCGVWIMSDRGTEAIHGGTSEMSAHAALSPDGRVIACGDENSPHRIFMVESGRFVLAAEIEPGPSSHAIFHDSRSHVCLGSRSNVFGLDLAVLETKKKKALHLSASEGAALAVHSGISHDKGYLLGDDDGCSLVTFEAKLLWHTRVGPKIVAMDSSVDSTRLFFGTSAGALVEYERTSEESLGRELRRWVFWRGFDPLVW